MPKKKNVPNEVTHTNTLCSIGSCDNWEKGERERDAQNKITHTHNLHFSRKFDSTELNYDSKSEKRFGNLKATSENSKEQKHIRHETTQTHTNAQQYVFSKHVSRVQPLAFNCAVLPCHCCTESKQKLSRRWGTRGGRGRRRTTKNFAAV